MSTNEEKIPTLEERVRGLEDQCTSLRKRGGGMLSSYDIKNRIIKDKKDIDKYLKYFTEHSWENINAEFGDDKFVIKPFEKYNLTPYSYDLSLGEEIYSLKIGGPKSQILQVHSSYKLTPSETVIVQTEQTIALPKCYSATVWPRFSFVREGIFQSMVKIDPTWYGKIAIAITNNSPAVFPLIKGMLFATLIIYELTTPTDYELREINDITIPDIDIIGNFDVNELNNKIKAEKIEGGFECYKDKDNKIKLKIKSPRKVDYLKLRDIGMNYPGINEALEKVEPGPQIGMEAYGQKNLNKIIVSEYFKGTRVDALKISHNNITKNRLIEMALNYGEPFDMIASLPEYIEINMDAKIESSLINKIQAEIGSTIFPKITTLMVSVIGLLSLVGATLAILVKFYAKETILHIPNEAYSTISISLAVLLVVIIFALYWIGKAKEPQKEIHKMKKDIKELRSEIDNLKSRSDK